MNLKDVIEKFSSEEQCKIAFKKLRLKQGVVCKKCGGTDHYWQSTRDQFECKKCRFRTTLRSGTILQHSKLPFQYWFMAMQLMTMTKKGISATELQFQLGHKRYEPIWTMMHKIRRGMGERDKRYQLSDEVEIDEAFFKTVNDLNDGPLKRGKGSQQNTTVLVMAESLPVKKENRKKYGKKKRSRYFKMAVVPSLTQEHINERVKENVNARTKVITDDFSSYHKLTEVVRSHKRHKSKEVDTNNVMPWVHTAIANAKRNLLGIHHRVDGKYLQNYLNEFCYKVNRRYLKEHLLERLLIAVVTTCLCI